MKNKYEELKDLAKNICFDEPMKNHTTFKIGGPADVFVDASSSEEIAGLIKYCKKNEIPYMIMGNGSNMLVGDGGIRGVVIKIGSNLNNIKIEDEVVTAEAGVKMAVIANEALKAELSGFETLSGIPGTLGGAIYMNAGAYGGEIKDIIESATYIDADGEIRTANKEELDLSYRHSMLENSGFAVISATMRLKKGNYDEIKAATLDYNKRRADKQPLSMPSAGSTFKRPEGHFAGKLIQDCGLMGVSVGDAQISEKHAGFVVNKGNATADDVMQLIEYVQKTVLERFDVKLEPEVRLIGEK